MLKGKTIVLGITGGIAAYKTAELVRILKKKGADVHCVMTEHAREFITPLTLRTLSGNTVVCDMFENTSEAEVGHVALADKADLYIIAPATANIIGKAANGIADDFLSTNIMAAVCPVVFVPAMNVHMYENPAYRSNEEKLRSWGYHFLDADEGELACGYSAKGRMKEPETIADFAEMVLTPDDLEGQKVLITAGPTAEDIDPVRYLTNRSSGKMGYALARAARNRGAEVVLVSGPVALDPVPLVENIRVRSADEMFEACLKHFDDSDIVIKSAAVADFRPGNCADNKLKKENGMLPVGFVPNRDILFELGRRKKGQFLAGFAAETCDLRENAMKKLKKKNLDMIAANDVSDREIGFASENNRITVYTDDGGVSEMPLMTKDETGNAILDLIIKNIERGAADA